MSGIGYIPRCVLEPGQNPSWGALRDGVREVDEPTFEIDWASMQRFSEWRSTRKNDAEYRGEEAHEAIVRYKEEVLCSREQRGMAGYTHKDAALNEAFSHTIPQLRFMGPGRARTPEQRGVSVYQGTPQENSGMVARALRLMGAATVGFVELYDDTTRKLIYDSEVKDGKRIVFEDAAVGYETEDKLVIPNAARWVIVYCVPMSGIGLAQAPSQLSRAATMQAYVRLYTIYNQLHEFLRALGYHSYGATIMNGFGVFPAFAVLGGLGELSRLDIVITPEYGPMVRLAALATDLPLAATRPISFGVREFCRKCRICAKACAVRSISSGEEPGWDAKGAWSNPGHQAYFRETMRCRDYFYKSGSNCGICLAKCPYSEPDAEKFRGFLGGTSGGKIDADAVMPANRRDPAGWWDIGGPELDIRSRFD